MAPPQMSLDTLLISSCADTDTWMQRSRLAEIYSKPNRLSADRLTTRSKFTAKVFDFSGNTIFLQLINEMI